ncbi:MAG: phospho-N-acetylmuramoyl-pentapeptide-transferase, partial [Ligilactobacillus salivarius]
MNSMLLIIAPAVCAFILTVIFVPMFISYFRKRKEGQMIREEGPKWHQKKSGTPTMGGFVFNLAILAVVLVFGLLTKNLHAKLL